MRDESDKVLLLGQPGEEGFPNAGKSTLLGAITLARPDIADYPFTTLMPNLGRLDGDPSLGAGRYASEATLAELPGLIEDTHLGKGLGRKFLRHREGHGCWFMLLMQLLKTLLLILELLKKNCGCTILITLNDHLLWY